LRVDTAGKSTGGKAVETVSFIVPGEPVPKARPRVTRNGTYTPEACREYEKRVAYFARQAMRGREPTKKAVFLCVTAFVTRPKKPKNKDLPITRPDTDNYLKAPMDAINKICYVDDGQVTDALARKRYAKDVTEARTVVTVTELDKAL
jgi:Holliday junction resolvase RusA-like endonuclease